MRGTNTIRKRRPLVLVAALAVLVVAGSGCAVVGGPTSPTSRADGDNASVGGILLRNVFVLGPRYGETVPAGSTAQIYLTLINRSGQPDRLLSVAAPEIARSVQIIGGSISLPQDEAVHPGENGPTLVLEDLTTALRGGEIVPITFEFAEAGTVEVNVPVMPYANFYRTYPAAPTPATTTPTPSPQ